MGAGGDIIKEVQQKKTSVAGFFLERLNPALSPVRKSSYHLGYNASQLAVVTFRVTYHGFSISLGKPSVRCKMRKSVAVLSVVLLAFPTLWAGQTAQQKPASRKSSIPAATPATPSAKPAEQPSKRAYAELSISELISEDPNRWTDRMAAHASVGGFVTQVTKRDDGDTDIRICENPRVEGMDRARCILSKCIPKLPCEVPQVGKPITVKGITRYEAKVGTHWWEINPVEQIEK
jgi:hypothetical protein